MTEVTCVGAHGNHSEYMVFPVTVGIASDPHGHVTEITCGIGAHGSHSECMVLPVTVGFASVPHGHVTGHICCRCTWKSP